MSDNIVTLGLEFQSKTATDGIQDVINNFNALKTSCDNAKTGAKSLSEKTIVDSVKKIANAFKSLNGINSSVSLKLDSIYKSINQFSNTGSIPKRINAISSAFQNIAPLNNQAVVQISALAVSIERLGNSTYNSSGIRDISYSLQTIKPISSDVANSIITLGNAFAKISLSADVVSNFSTITHAMAALKQIDPAIALSLHQFVFELNNLKQIDPAIAQSISTVFGAISSVNIDKNTVAMFNQFVKTITKMGVIKPQIAVSVRELFSAIKSATSINANVVASIEKLAKVIRTFKVIRPEIAQSVSRLFDSFKKVQIISKDKINSVRKFAEATYLFRVIRPNVVNSIQTLFNILSTASFQINQNTVSSIASLGQALNGLRAVTETRVKNVEKLFNLFATMKPVPQNALNSITSLTSLFNAMGAVKGNGLSNTGNSITTLVSRADALSISLRTLQGAFSVRYIRDAIREANAFGMELAYIQTIADEFDISAVSNGIKDFSSLIGSATDNANAFYYAYSSGIRGTEKDLLAFTEENAKLSKVIRANVTDTMNVTTAMINAYDYSARDIQRISDNISGIVKYGKASGANLASGLGQVIPTAHTAGLTIEELSASLATLTKVMETRNAITYFNNMLSKMIKPTVTASNEAKRLGIELGLTAIRAKGFSATMREIYEKTQGSEEALLKIFPDLRGMRSALHLLGGGWNDFNHQLKNFNNISGETDKELSALTNSIEAQLFAIPNTFKKIASEAGKAIISVMTLNGTLLPLISSFNNMGSSVRKGFGFVGLYVASLISYKAVILAINTYQAIQIKNNAVLIAQQMKLNSLRTKGVLGATLYGVHMTTTSAVKGMGAFSNLPLISGLARSIGFITPSIVYLTTALKPLNKNISAFVASSLLLKSNLSSLSVVGAKTGMGIGTLSVTVGGLIATVAGLGYGLGQLIYKIQPVKEILDDWFGSTKAQQTLDSIAKDEELSKSLHDSYMKTADSEKEIADMREETANYTMTLTEKYKASAERIAKAQEELNKLPDLETLKNLGKDIYAQGRIGFKKTVSDFGGNQFEYDLAKKDWEDNLKRIASNNSDLIEKRKNLETELTSALKEQFDLNNEMQKFSESMVRSIQNMVYQFMSDNEKEQFHLSQFQSSIQDYITNIDDMNKELADKSIDSFLESYSYLKKEYTKAINENTKISDDFTKSIDSMFNQLFPKSSSEYNLSDTQKLIANGEYSNAVSMFNEYIGSLQRELSVKKELAQAEEQAIRNTQQMILSMDKFNSRTVNAVQSGSIEALSLQNREFGSISSLATPSMQSSVEQQNQRILDEMKSFGQSLRNKIEIDNQSYRENITKLDSVFGTVSKAVENEQETIRTGFTDLIRILSSNGVSIKLPSEAKALTVVRAN